MTNYPLPATYDNTMLSTYLECPQKFFWTHIRELRKIGTGVAADFGAWMHTVLAHYYTAILEGEKRSVELMKHCVAEVPAWPESADLLDSLYTQATGEFLLTAYAEHYKGERLEPTMVEQSFALPIEGQFLYVGRIDLVGIVESVNSIVDHKTTTRLGPSFIRKISPNRQGTGYIWALRQYVDDISSFVLNGIRVTANRKNPGFVRTFPANRMEYDIDKWQKDTLEIIEHILRSYQRRSWIMNTDACSNFGDCPYRTLCLMRKDPYELRPPGTYEHHRWEPYAGAKFEFVDGTD